MFARRPAPRAQLTLDLPGGAGPILVPRHRARKARKAAPVWLRQADLFALAPQTG